MEEQMSEQMPEKKVDKKLFLGIAIGVGALIVIALLVWGVVILLGAGAKSAQAKAEKFINEQLLPPGQGTATVKVVDTVGGIYKLKIEYNGQIIDSYMSKDAKLFFPQAYDIKDLVDDNQAQAGAEVPKSDKPNVELFVMSYCPYGIQMEKGILPVVKALGDKIDFNLKFVSYTMHGEEETQENLLQYCIDKEQKGKLLGYLDCFLKSGDSASCLRTTGVDTNKTNTCLQNSAKQFDVSGEKFSVYEADNAKYGVQGSPTLIINGAQASSGRDSASLLSTICGAFNNAPSECQQKLSTASPSPAFGEGTVAGASTDASCE